MNGLYILEEPHPLLFSSVYRARVLTPVSLYLQAEARPFDLFSSSANRTWGKVYSITFARNKLGGSFSELWKQGRWQHQCSRGWRGRRVKIVWEKKTEPVLGLIYKATGSERYTVRGTLASMQEMWWLLSRGKWWCWEILPLKWWRRWPSTKVGKYQSIT